MVKKGDADFANCYFDSKDIAKSTYQRINFDGLFCLQYAYKKYITDPYSTLISEFFVDSESMLSRKSYLMENPLLTIEMLFEGAAIIEKGMIVCENKKTTC